MTTVFLNYFLFLKIKEIRKEENIFGSMYFFSKKLKHIFKEKRIIFKKQQNNAFRVFKNYFLKQEQKISFPNMFCLFHLFSLFPLLKNTF